MDEVGIVVRKYRLCYWQKMDRKVLSYVFYKKVSKRRWLKANLIIKKYKIFLRLLTYL